MSDINCAVCAEPWDQYGVMHGDMAKWEVDLFRKGAGCPCCKGAAPDHVDADAALEKHLRSVVMESEDPDRFARLHDPESRPKWERPADTVVGKCAGCDSELRVDLDTSDRYWHTPTVDRYYHNRPGGYSWETDGDVWIKVDGKDYCQACATYCNECGEPVFQSGTSCTGEVLYGDTYDAGASFCSEQSYQTVCLECFENETRESNEDEDSDEDSNEVESVEEDGE